MSDLFKDPPPKWVELLVIVAGVATLLFISGLAMIGAALLIVLNGG